MKLTLFGNGLSYLVFKHSESNQYVELDEYLFKLSIIRESVVTIKHKLILAKKINELFFKLGHQISLKRILCSINHETANIIRQQIKHKNLIEINDNSIKKSHLMRYPYVEGCFFEENAHYYTKFNTLNCNTINFNHITLELKIKCGLTDFADYPNLFTIRNKFKRFNSNSESFNPAKLFSNSVTEIREQLLLLTTEINRKYLKIFINGKIIDNSEITNPNLLVIISNAVKSSNGLICDILKLQANSSGQQFLAHVIYLLLDIFYQHYGHVSDSWKIYYLQLFKKFNTSNLMKLDNHLFIQVDNYKRGLFLIKSLLSLLISIGHIKLISCLRFFLNDLNLNVELHNGIRFNPLLKLREYLEKYSRRGYPNTSLRVYNSLKSLYGKYNVIKDSIEWLQNYFVGRTMMDCSMIYNFHDLNTFIEKTHVYNNLMNNVEYSSNNNSIRISLVDLDIKPYKRVVKWANDANIAIKNYRNNLYK